MSFPSANPAIKTRPYTAPKTFPAKHMAQTLISGSCPIVKPSAITHKKVLALGTLTGVALCLAYILKPFALEGWNKLKHLKLNHINEPLLQKWQAKQRQRYFEGLILKAYVKSPDARINWYQFADIVDFVARNTPSDSDFRKDLWYLFGWRAKGHRSSLAKYLDPLNRGLPKTLHNSHYQSEQMHHYLGGTTGNTDFIPSHLQNNHLYAYCYELQELFTRGQYNWGDVHLFNVSEKHRDDFLKHGRFTVAPNIRAILELSQQQVVSIPPAPISRRTSLA